MKTIFTYQKKGQDRGNIDLEGYIINKAGDGITRDYFTEKYLFSRKSAYVCNLDRVLEISYYLRTWCRYRFQHGRIYRYSVSPC